MITASDIALLRLFLADPPDTGELFHDDTLEALWDDNDEDVYAAAADGWRVKAAKASELYAAQIDGSLLSRDQIWQHCIQMADHFEKLGGATIVSVKLDTDAGATSADASFEM